MPIYIYKAKTKPDSFQTGTIEAENERAAVNKLLLLNYHPISLKLKTEERSGKNPFFNKITPKDIYIFLRQLSNLILAGLPLVKALTNLSLQNTNQKLKNRIIDLKEKIQHGKTFSEALGGHTDIFSALEISMIKSAEATGKLPEVIVKIADLKERDITFNNRIRSSLAYPVLLIIVGSLTLFVLTTFVLPKFVVLFQDLGQELPIATKALINLSLFLNKNWVILFLFAVVFYFFIIRFIKTEKGKIWLDSFLLKIPFLRDIIIRVQTGRFARTLGSLLENGVPIINSLQIVSDLATNMVFSREIKNVYILVAKGQHISECLKNSAIFEKDVLDLIGVGEEGGRLEEMLFRIADMNEREASERIETFMIMFEPVLILVLGFIIAMIVMAILLPIFQMNFLIQ